MTNIPAVSEFLAQCASRRYQVFDDDTKGYNLNIVGWRVTPLDAESSDTFDDFISAIWKHKGYWEHRIWPATTVPGKRWLFSPIDPKGTAILCPGQYVAAYYLGEYKGYTALKQGLSVAVYRDNNRDSALNASHDRIERGKFGIHIHRAGALSTFIGLYSAGCQVFKRADDFDEFIELCTKARKNWGNCFTYTLLEI